MWPSACPRWVRVRPTPGGVESVVPPRFSRSFPRACAAVVVAGLLIVTASCASDDAASSGAGKATVAESGYKITVAGDSISVGLGGQLRTLIGSEAVVKVIGEEGTGLARPDEFNWPQRLSRLSREFPPQVLIFSVGSNDAQDLVDEGGAVVAPLRDAAAWDAEYGRRLAASFDAFAGTGTTVVWVGHVRTAEDRVGSVNRRIHHIAERVAAARPFVIVSDLGALLKTGDLEATACLLPDGLHLTVPCLDLAAAGLRAQLPRH